MDVRIALDARNKKMIAIVVLVLAGTIAAVVGAMVAFPDNVRARLAVLVLALAAVVGAVFWILQKFVARRSEEDARAAGERIIDTYRDGGSVKGLLDECERYLDANIALEARIDFMERIARMLIEDGHARDARTVVAFMTDRNLLPDGERKLDAAVRRLGM